MADTVIAVALGLVLVLLVFSSGFWFGRVTDTPWTALALGDTTAIRIQTDSCETWYEKMGYGPKPWKSWDETVKVVR